MRCPESNFRVDTESDYWENLKSRKMLCIQL